MQYINFQLSIVITSSELLIVIYLSFFNIDSDDIMCTINRNPQLLITIGVLLILLIISELLITIGVLLIVATTSELLITIGVLLIVYIISELVCTVNDIELLKTINLQ